MRVPRIHQSPPPTQVHQPRMKVFTVGLDDKEKQKNLDEKLETGSVVSNGSEQPKIATQITPPPPANQRKVHKGPFRTWFSCLLAVFFVLIIALTLSEIAYNRHRDEQYLRLKWAELKQRMLGMEILRQSQLQVQQQQQQQQAAINPIQSISNDMPPEVIDERLAFSKRLEQEKNGVDTNRVDNSVETSQEQQNGDVRLAFLKAILEKIRKAASNGELPSPVHVSVLEIKKQPLIGENEEDLDEMPQNMADGFGEWAAPSPFGGPQEFPQNEGAQFDRFTWRGDRFPQMQQVENSGEAQPWMFNDDNGGMMDGPMIEGAQEGNGERPQLRITHHFDRENAMMPARIVTELYGDDASEFVRNFMNPRQAAAGQQQPPMQQVQFPMAEPQPWMAPQMPQQATPDQQRFAAEFGQTFGTNFGLNWERAQQQNQMPWQFQMPIQQQFAQQQAAQQQQQQPMNAWQQWQNQWQPQQPQMVQTFQQQQQQQQQPQPAASVDSQMPWYHNWIQENKPEQMPVIEGATAEKKNENRVDEEPKFTDLNEEDQGDDGFERKEQFNVPTDVLVDEQPEVVEHEKSEEKPFIPAEAISSDDSFHVDKNSPFFQIDDPSSFVAKA